MRLDHLLSKELKELRSARETKHCSILKIPKGQRGCSSAGRAPALQAGGQEFDPPHLHQRVKRNEQNHYGRIAQVVRAHA